MATTSVWVRPLVLSSILVFSGVAACGSPDDSDLLMPGDGTSSGFPEEDAGTSLKDGAVSADTGTTDVDGSRPSGDAGTDASTTNAFTGAGAHQNTTGPSSRKGDHNFQGNIPTTNPAKQACLSCHGGGGDAPRFLFAGTVFADTNGQQPAVSVEVAVRDSAGNRVIVRTDQDGNFYRKPGAGDPAFPAQTAARDAANVRLMTGTIAANGGGDCNACHKTGAAGVIHVP